LGRIAGDQCVIYVHFALLLVKVPINFILGRIPKNLE
jgi:hypothetical protein